MKKRFQILIPVFNTLHRRVLEEYSKILHKREAAVPNGTGARLYGFDGWEYDKDTIRKVLAEDPRVKEFLKSFFQANYKRSDAKMRSFNKPNFTDTVIGGKYLYDKRLQAEKSIETITLADQYCELYTNFLGYKDFREFVKKECTDLSPKEKNSQLNLLSRTSNDYLSGTSTRFLSYYYSYRDDIIKKFVLDIGYTNGKAIQTGFHFRSNGSTNKSIEEVSIDPSTIYKGKVTNAGKSGLAITLHGREGEERNYMSIMLYRGGMNIQDMSLARGNLQTMSAHGYIFSSEIFLIRVNEHVAISKLLAPAYDIHISLGQQVAFIKKYLYLQRRTFRIPQSNEQNILKVTAKKKPLKLLDPMIGTWKVWGLDKKNRVIQSRLEVQPDYSSKLHIYSAKGEEEQVCLFRISEDRNGYNLWISAHEADGVELKNIALVEIPDIFSKNTRITVGASCGVGVRKQRFGLSRIVLIRITEQEKQSFKPVILEKYGLMQAMFSTEKNDLHIKAYALLEKEVKRSGKFKKFIKYTALSEGYDKVRNYKDSD